MIGVVIALGLWLGPFPLPKPLEMPAFSAVYLGEYPPNSRRFRRADRST